MTNPKVIRIINDQVASGVYQQISTVIESERMLGRLQGMSDIQAYQHVGKAIEANGGFNTSPESNVAETKVEPVKKVEDHKLRDRKKAASSTKSTVSKKSTKEFNPLAMSDAEFEKLGNSQLL